MNTICLTCFILSTVTSGIHQKGSNKVVYNFNSFSRSVLVSLINTNMGLANIKKIITFIFIEQFCSSVSYSVTINLVSTIFQNGKDCNNLTFWDDNILQIFVFNKLCLIRRISPVVKGSSKKKDFFLHFVD